MTIQLLIIVGVVAAVGGLVSLGMNHRSRKPNVAERAALNESLYTIPVSAQHYTITALAEPSAETNNAWRVTIVFFQNAERIIRATPLAHNADKFSMNLDSIPEGLSRREKIYLEHLITMIILLYIQNRSKGGTA